MRLLFVLPHFLVPANTGNKILTLNLLKYLTTRCNCDLAILVDGTDENSRRSGTLRGELPSVGEIHFFEKPHGWRALRARLAALMRGGHPALGRYHSSALSDWLQQRTQDIAYDAIHFDMIHTAQYRSAGALRPTVLVASDAYSLAARRARATLRRPGEVLDAMAQEVLFRHYERSTYGRFDAVVTVSSVDRDHLKRSCPGAELHVVGVALPAPFSEAPLPDARERQSRGPGVLVTGSLDHAGVARGVVDYLMVATRYVRGDNSRGVTLLGQRPHRRLRRLLAGMPCVRHLEYVPDAAYRELLLEDWVYVYPQRCGTGLQTKVQQAMAMGLPVVGFPVAFGGLEVQSGEHCLIGRTEAEIHLAVRRLLADAALRDRIGRAAAAWVRSTFALAPVGCQMMGVYQRAIDGHSSQAPSGPPGRDTHRRMASPPMSTASSQGL